MEKIDEIIKQFNSVNYDKEKSKFSQENKNLLKKSSEFGKLITTLKIRYNNDFRPAFLCGFIIGRLYEGSVK